MHFREEEFARDRFQRENDRALENLLEAIRVQVTGQENGRRSEFRRRAGNMRRPRVNNNQRQERHRRHTINQRRNRRVDSRGPIRSRPTQRPRANTTDRGHVRRETPRRDNRREICDLRHSLPRHCE